MEVFKSISEIRTLVNEYKSEKKTIGLVPTMGALHEGHLQLVRTCNDLCDVTIASIFVNPAQFNNKEDLEKYPTTLEEDLKKLENAKCNAVFTPTAHEIYPGQTNVNLDFGVLSSQLEGKFRPGHFNGVGLVVSKLFNIVEPHRAFFGQKDLQQFFIIKALRDQLNFPVELTMVSTVREASGLAMSSRNLRLSSEDRNEASLLFNALDQAKEMLLQSDEVKTVRMRIQELFNASERLALEYFEVINTIDFTPLEQVTDRENTAMCIAAEIGGVRLIDNLMLIS